MADWTQKSHYFSSLSSIEQCSKGIDSRLASYMVAIDHPESKLESFMVSVH